MRLGIFWSDFPPNAGGIRISFETMARWLEARGHQIVSKPPWDAVMLSWYSTDRLVALRGSGVPLVGFVDSYWHLVRYGTDCDLIVFNTDHLQAEAPWRQVWADKTDLEPPYPLSSMVLHPPVLRAEWQVRQPKLRAYWGTIIGMSAKKGIETFYELAANTPDRAFLAVEGLYGEQIKTDLENVTMLPAQTPRNLREQVYARTRELIVPSVESYGRVIVEARYAGVPLVDANTNMTEGKREALSLPDSEIELAELEGILTSLAC